MGKISPRDCEHTTLNFNSGDYYILCHDCNRSWVNCDLDTAIANPYTANQRIPVFDSSRPRVMIDDPTIFELTSEELNVEKYSLVPALKFILNSQRDDLTIRQLAVLISCLEGDQTVKGLAERFGISRPAITRAADKLCEIGFMVRKSNTADRRSVFLRLTAAGHKYAGNFS